MRLREFQQRKQIQEAFFLPAIGWGLTVGGIAWQAYDTYNDIQEYNNSEKTQADLDKLKAAVGEDILYGLVGAGAGVVVGKAIQLGASPLKKIYNAYKNKGDKADDVADSAADSAAVTKGDEVIAANKAGEKVDDAPQLTNTKPETANPEVKVDKPQTKTDKPDTDTTSAGDTTPDVSTSAGSTAKVKPGDTVTSASGNQKVAGVDGKATTVDPGDAAGVAKIKKAAKDTPDATAGAAASKGAKKADTDATAGAAASKGAKKSDAPSGKAGAVASKGAKKSDAPSGKAGAVAGKSKIPSKRAGAVGSKLIGPAAGVLVAKAAQDDANAADKAQGQGQGQDGDTGPLFYMGARKGPPKKVISLKDRPR